MISRPEITVVWCLLLSPMMFPLVSRLSVTRITLIVFLMTCAWVVTTVSVRRCRSTVRVTLGVQVRRSTCVLTMAMLVRVSCLRILLCRRRPTLPERSCSEILRRLRRLQGQSAVTRCSVVLSRIRMKSLQLLIPNIVLVALRIR